MTATFRTRNSRISSASSCSSGTDSRRRSSGVSTRESTPTAIAPSGCLLCLQQSTEPIPAPDARNETPPATSVADVRLNTDFAGYGGPEGPSGGVVARIIDEVYELCRADTSGTPADHIPELAAVQPDSFGICLATADRPVHGSGDPDAAFTIRSISEPFTYAPARCLYTGRCRRARGRRTAASGPPRAEPRPTPLVRSHDAARSRSRDQR
ncbi:glutaminase [Nocardia sp. NPDC004123]